MTITTPSGIVLEVKEQPTFGDHKAVKLVMQDAMKFDLNKQEAKDLGMSFLTRAQEVLFDRIILSIQFPDGRRLTEKFMEAIDQMSIEDGEYVFSALDEKYQNVLHPSAAEKKTE